MTVKKELENNCVSIVFVMTDLLAYLCVWVYVYVPKFECVVSILGDSVL